MKNLYDWMTNTHTKQNVNENKIIPDYEFERNIIGITIINNRLV